MHFTDRQFIAPENGYGLDQRLILMLLRGYQGEGNKTVIPNEARAKITCRLVDQQDREEIFEAVSEHYGKSCPKGVEFSSHRLAGSGKPFRECLKKMLRELQVRFLKKFMVLHHTFPDLEQLSRLYPRF